MAVWYHYRTKWKQLTASKPRSFGNAAFDVQESCNRRGALCEALEQLLLQEPNVSVLGFCARSTEESTVCIASVSSTFLL